jgi:hypothetical protein
MMLVFAPAVLVLRWTAAAATAATVVGEVLCTTIVGFLIAATPSSVGASWERPVV